MFNDASHVPDDYSLQDQIDDLRILIAQQARDINKLEHEIADLQAELSDFETRYNTLVKPISDQVEAAKNAIKQVEHLLMERLMGQHTPLETLWKNSRRPNNTPPDMHLPDDDLPAASAPKNLNLKQLYRDLARTFHPDLALNEADRAERTRLMALINRAYQEGDAETLHALQSDEASTETNTQGVAPIANAARASLDKLVLRQLQDQAMRGQTELESLRAQRSELRYGAMMDLKIESTLAQAQGRDLLQEIATSMQEDYWEHIRKLDQLRAELDETPDSKPDDRTSPPSP
jgi:SMC interacting uncharacterized protein involved in chromosome segregation